MVRPLVERPIFRCHANAKEGLHFSPDGYRVLYAELMKLIERRWPEQIPEKLSYVLPAWGDGPEWAKEGLEMGKRDVVAHE